MDVLEIILNPVFQGFFWAAAGLAVKTFCPAFVPILGIGKKLTQELLHLHELSNERNQDIADRARKLEYKTAEKKFTQYVEKKK